jgi:hypothetical protein
VFADRVFIREMAIGEGLVDDHDALRASHHESLNIVLILFSTTPNVGKLPGSVGSFPALNQVACQSFLTV